MLEGQLGTDAASSGYNVPHLQMFCFYHDLLLLYILQMSGIGHFCGTDSGMSVVQPQLKFEMLSNLYKKSR